MDVTTLQASTLARMIRAGLFASEAREELRARIAPPAKRAIPLPAKRRVGQSNGYVDLGKVTPGFRGARILPGTMTREPWLR